MNTKINVKLAKNVNLLVNPRFTYRRDLGAGASGIGTGGLVGVLNYKPTNGLREFTSYDGKYGLVGDITKIDKKVLKNLIKEKFIPVIAPIAAGDDVDHPGYNINADLAASKIAVALKAKKIIFLTDTPGVLDKEGNLISSLDKAKIKALKKDGTISGGMIPKLDACLETLRGGVERAHIIDGRVEHSILLELFTKDGIGTIIKE
jgi:acetylglutamate kinase